MLRWGAPSIGLQPCSEGLSVVLPKREGMWGLSLSILSFETNGIIDTLFWRAFIHLMNSVTFATGVVSHQATRLATLNLHELIVFLDAQSDR
jgi:hypothetical protein